MCSGASAAGGRATAIVPARIQVPLGDAAESVVAATRTQARRQQGLAIAADFNARGYRPVQLDEREHACTGCGVCALVCPDVVFTVYRVFAGLAIFALLAAGVLTTG